MSTRILMVGTAIAASLLLAGAQASAEGSGGSGGNGSDSIGSWVIGAGPGGGVSPPAGTTCTGWDHAANQTPGVGVGDLSTVRIDDAGQIWNLYYRICGSSLQYIWVPLLSPVELGAIAFDEVLCNLPRPAPSLSPSLATGGYVNFETWLAVANPGTVTATASIPGLSATATAQVTGLEWLPGDGSAVVSCEPFGALPPEPGFVGPAPCGHTFTSPSAPVTGASAALRFDGQVTLAWHASWTSSDGASGDLGEARTATALPYRVREIQTIGVDG